MVEENCTNDDAQNDSPSPLVVIQAETEAVGLFDDGEYVVTGEGVSYCSEHGSFFHDEYTAGQCNHSGVFDSNKGTPVVPEFQFADFSSTVFNDPEMKRHAAEHEDVIEQVMAGGTKADTSSIDELEEQAEIAQDRLIAELWKCGHLGQITPETAKGEVRDHIEEIDDDDDYERLMGRFETMDDAINRLSMRMMAERGKSPNRERQDG